MDIILEKAIDELRKTYEEAKNMSFICNPIAFALYSTWKMYDRQESKRRLDNERTS